MTLADQTAGRPSGHLFVISAPSGAGKTSLVRALIERAGGLGVSVSHTTRARRAGEEDGVAYHFIDEARFVAMVAAGEFLEHAQVFDHRYGTARGPVAARLAAGEDVILEIDWQGARSVRAALPDTISVFILPPSVEALERRLTGRGDRPEAVARRMRDAVSEMSHYGEYDYLVVNDDFERAAADLLAIVGAARLRRAVQVERHAAMLARLVAP
ncbi:MAG: guanylate kinase [Gammaproteobacteria bacterium]